MTKKKAIIKFCVICVLTALGVSLIFANFRIPFTETRFHGFAGAIESRMGIDLRGGILAVFQAEPPQNPDGTPRAMSPDDFEAAMRGTEERLRRSLDRAHFTEATVQRQGTDRFRVEVPGLDPTETDAVFRAIGEPSRIDFRNEQHQVVVEPEHIIRVQTNQNPQNFEWGVLVTFTSEGGRLFRNLIQNATSHMYIFENGEEMTQVQITDRTVGANNQTVITLGNVGGRPANAEDALNFQRRIESGLFELQLDLLNSSFIPETLGPNALLGAIIALIIALVFIFAFMFLRYGDLGLLSNLSIMIYMVLFLASLAVVNAVQLTLPGIAGIILALAMAVDANIIIFERAKDEYRSGKRMAIAVENGFKKSLWTIFDSNITTIIGGVVLFFLGTGPIRGFAITLMLGVAISMFCSLVLTRSFAKLYLYINPTNSKRLKLTSTNPYIQEIDPKGGQGGKGDSVGGEGNGGKTSMPATPQKRRLNV